MDPSGEAHRLQMQGNKGINDVWRNYLTENTAHKLQIALGVWGLRYDAFSDDGASTINLVRALEFPRVQASLFRSEAEIAPPDTIIEEASGRFGIVFRQVVTPRPAPKPGEEFGPGKYDMLAHTELLVRPVQHVRLFRDGRLHVEPSFIRRHKTLWHEAEELGCLGWLPGFNFGDANASNDADASNYFGGLVNEEMKSTLNPAGSLFEFYTTIDLPLSRAAHTEISVEMNREATGFVRGTYLHYDLNGDGVPDLIVWEGQGRYPGYRDGPTIPDDSWYRLVLVNVDDAWKVLGSDVFHYECGC
jgi:hypothetical protein